MSASIFAPFVWIYAEFVGLFNALKKEWIKLKPLVQNALIHGVGVINTIAGALDKVPADVVKLIQSAYPNLPIDKFKSALALTLKDLGIVEAGLELPLEDLIAKLQAYFKSKGSDKPLWSALSEASSILATYIEDGVNWQTVKLLVEFVYQHFFKKAE